MVLNVNDIPVLNGLVLAGGKSTRMGKPKDQINWHGKEQRYYLADLLAPFCDQVYISCRENQSLDCDPNYLFVSDSFSDIGPLAGILSAFQTSPATAWLVIACDIPLLDRDSIEHLINSRNASKIATAYESPIDKLPEPLIAIWEPKSYPILNHCLATGNTSLRKALINNDTLIIKPSKPELLLNVNTPDELLKAMEIIKEQ